MLDMLSATEMRGDEERRRGCTGSLEGAWVSSNGMGRMENSLVTKCTAEIDDNVENRRYGGVAKGTKPIRAEWSNG